MKGRVRALSIDWEKSTSSTLFAGFRAISDLCGQRLSDQP